MSALKLPADCRITWNRKDRTFVLDFTETPPEMYVELYRLDTTTARVDVCTEWADASGAVVRAIRENWEEYWIESITEDVQSHLIMVKPGDNVDISSVLDDLRRYLILHGHISATFD